MQKKTFLAKVLIFRNTHTWRASALYKDHCSYVVSSSYIVQLHWKLFSAAMLYKYAFQPRTKIFHPFNEETFQQVHGKLQIWSNLATVYQSNGIGFPFDKNKSWQKVKVGKLETTSYHLNWIELFLPIFGTRKENQLSANQRYKGFLRNL